MSTRLSNRRSSNTPSNNAIENERKNRKRRMSSQYVNSGIVCPACTITVRGEDNFRQHYDQEIRNATVNVDAKKKSYYMRLRSQTFNECEDEEAPKTLEERTKFLNDVRKRRYERYTDMFIVSMKRRKFQNCNNNQTTHSSTSNDPSQDVVETSSAYELITCAVCNEFLETTNCKRHISKCFAKHDYHFELYSSSEDENEDGDNENVSLPQSWAYMDNEYYRREGQLTRLVVEDVDEELDIDGDTDTQFGYQQFSEGDIIPCLSDKPETEAASEEALRQAVNTFPCRKSPTLSCDSKPSNDVTDFSTNQNNNHEKIMNIIQSCGEDKNKLYESIKRHINKIEDKYEREILKCPICMGPYNEPAVSISCWHTCCSDCWLRVLGTKKLCPKCNNIVSPSQLRKIFL